MTAPVRYYWRPLPYQIDRAGVQPGVTRSHDMRRTIVLGVLLAAGALSVAVGAYQPAGGQQPKVIEVEKLKDNFWVLKGGGGNSSVFVTTNGVVVVDTKNPGWG